MARKRIKIPKSRALTEGFGHASPGGRGPALGEEREGGSCPRSVIARERDAIERLIKQYQYSAPRACARLLTRAKSKLTAVDLDMSAGRCAVTSITEAHFHLGALAACIGGPDSFAGHSSSHTLTRRKARS